MNFTACEHLCTPRPIHKLKCCLIHGSKPIMSDKSSQEVSESRKSKYYTRAAMKQSLDRKRKPPRNVESKHSSERRAKIYKETFQSFRRKMIQAYGEEFYYKGGSWHGQESRRYRNYHIRKSMHFLTENMNSSDEE